MRTSVAHSEAAYKEGEPRRGGYSPFGVSDARFSTSGQLDLAHSSTTHPILQGVTAEFYFTNGNYTIPVLTTGSSLIAVDTAGNPWWR
jgi:ABC-type phosphate transport system substrate-binding protein